MTYLKNVIKDKHIASITPTSTYGVKKVCCKIDFSRRNVIVEYGPATGVFSTYLLQQLTEHSKLVLIETNNNFVSILRKKIKDPRVKIVHDSAEYVSKIIKDCAVEQADYIISGIPFTFMNEETRKLIVQQTYKALKKGGKFLPYQTFFQKDRHLKNFMEKYFNKVTDEYCFLNAPPMRIYEGVK